MEIVRFRLLSRVGFFIGAIVMFAGLGVYLMGHTTAGVVVLIVGLVVAMLCLSVTRFFNAYDFRHLTDKRKPVYEEKEGATRKKEDEADEN